MSVNDKRCRQCGECKPIREFDLPRHRLCTACRTHGVMGAVERGSSAGAPTVRPPSPITDWQGRLDYAMVRARQTRAAKEAWQRAIGKPMPAPKHPSNVKWCVRCKQQKPAMQFDHPRDRVCLACYNPNAIKTGVNNA